MTVLISGYGPFGSNPINPAWETARHLDGKIINGVEIKAVQLPVNVINNVKILKSSIETFNPSIILGLGVAPGRSILTLERFGVNLLDLPLPDEANNHPIGEPIVPDGPEAYQSTIPIKAIVMNMRKEGIPSAVSYSGGTHGCNQVLYWMLHYINTKQLRAKTGFIHLPYLPEQVANMNEDAINMYQPSMSLDLMVKGLEIAIHTSLEKKKDIERGYGLMC